MKESNPQFPFGIVTAGSIARLLENRFKECIEVVRNAYDAHERGESVNPHSHIIRFPDRPNARIIALPAHLPHPWNVSGIKWIASYPDNVAQKIPRASAVLILNNHANGYAYACLESSIISAARTAASATLAAGYLSHGQKDVRTLGIIGTGYISAYVYRFLLADGWRIQNVQLFDQNTARAVHFGSHRCDRSQHADVSVAATVDAVIHGSDLVLFATTASKPHVHDPAVLAHCPVVLHLSLRDLAPEILLTSNNVVDDVEHVLTAETSVHLAEKLSGSRTFISGTLAGLWRGTCFINPAKPHIFSPFGLGLLDLAVGQWIYEAAVAAGEVMNIGDFYGDLE